VASEIRARHTTSRFQHVFGPRQLYVIWPFPTPPSASQSQEDQNPGYGAVFMPVRLTRSLNLCREETAHEFQNPANMETTLLAGSPVMGARILLSFAHPLRNDVPSSRTTSPVLAAMLVDAMTKHVARSGDVALTWQILEHVAIRQHHGASSSGPCVYAKECSSAHTPMTIRFVCGQARSCARDARS
jgi:hypothetical protein